MRITSLLFACLIALTLSAQQPKKSAKPQQKARTTAVTQKTAAKKGGTAQQKKKTTSKGKQKSSTKQQYTNKDIQKLQGEQARLKKQMSENESLLKSTKKDVRSQLSNLNLIDAQIGENQRYIAGIQSEIDTLTNNIGTLTSELRALEKDLAECKRKYRHGVMYMFRNRNAQSKLMFIFAAKDFRQMYHRLRYAQDYSKYERAQGLVIKHKEEAVQRKRNELLGVKVQKDNLMAEGRQQQTKLEGQKRERQTVVNELNKKSAQLQSAINQQRKQYNSLNARIDALIQKEIAAAEARRKAAEEKARREAAQAEAARKKKAEAEAQAAKSKKGKTSTSAKSETKTAEKSQTTTPKFNAPDNADRALSSSFANNKGRLPVPITGAYTISSHFGQYNVAGLNGVTLDNKGINLTGRAGAQARCVFDGEVSAIFSYGGMVNIIVRHGSYMSVYCNLSSAAVHQGQKVSTRQTLGTVARDASGNCTLHFQLRKETAKLNPEAWIGR